MQSDIKLLSGNEAIARGAYEVGVKVASGYPGTPSTEIMETVATYHDIYCEWAPNEKVAFETAAGAALTGARAMTTMKHVGLNVAADPLMTLAYLGVVGGMVVCVADDPGMYSSQNEQDTRNYARFAKIPLLEPSDSQDALDFFKLAISISEEYRTPVILRTTTRVSHSRSIVKIGERQTPVPTPGFVKNPKQFVSVPAHTRGMRVRLEERLRALQTAAALSPANRLEWRDRSLGIVAEGVAYQYAREVFPEASILKIGWAYPFPDDLLRKFAAGVQRILVVEELDDILEQHLKAMGIACEGRSILPGIGELSPDILADARRKLSGKPTPAKPSRPAMEDLPPRPPVLCPGCPHRGVFHALGKFDVIVTSDIGCYSLGFAPPLMRLDTILCMGGGISMAHGMQKAGEPHKVVGIVGDSTFFHSGITGLLNIAYNRGLSTIIVTDNRTTAMTGHQDNPGTGRTLMGESVPEVDIAAIGRACGLQRIFTVNPYHTNEFIKILRECLQADATEPALIVARAPCPLATRKPVGTKRRVLTEKCKQCGQCLKIACPAVERTADGAIRINPVLCSGCGLCAQVCKFGAITTKAD